MRIGIDIDDTISNTSEYMLEEAIIYDRNVTKKGINDPLAYDFIDIFNWDKMDKLHFYKYVYRNELHDVPVKPHAKEVINKLKKEGHEIYIITRRNHYDFKDPYDASKKWLKRNGIKYDKLNVCSFDKGDACREFKIDLFIDDMPNNCKRVSEENIDVLLFNSPYNREEDRFKRVISWEQIYDIVSR